MRKFVCLSLAALAAVSLAACETTSTRPYKASTQNVIEIENAFSGTSEKVRIGNFSAASGVNVEPTCRMMGAVDVAPGKNVVQYIKEAMQEEFYMADAYSDSADVTIEGKIDQFDFNSVGRGSWNLGMTVSSSAYPEGYSVTKTYDFSTSFTAVSACQNVVDAFGPAVQELLAEVVNHPEFSTLIGAGASS